MREKVVEIFIESLIPYLNVINSVAIVGGNATDPEIQELIKLKQITVDCYGIDQGLIHLDLNLPYNNNDRYDLVICSQVLEHLYDVRQAIENLVNLTNSNGYIWIGCPASNRSHGSPHYYSAGYQPEMIINLLNLFSIKILFFGKLGSKRLYFMTHALRIWPSQKELKRPIFGYDLNRRNESLAKKLFVSFMIFQADFIHFFFRIEQRIKLNTQQNRMYSHQKYDF